MQCCSSCPLLIFSSLCNTLYRYQYPRRKRHNLWGAPCRCIVRKKLYVNLVYYRKVIPCYHKYGRLNNLGYVRPSVFEDCLNVRKALSYLLFKVRTDNLSGSRVDSWSSRYKYKVVSYNGLRESVTHSWSS